MKNLITKAAILCILISLFGCHKKQGDVAQKTVVAGKVTNRQKRPDIKQFTLQLVDLSGNEGYIGSIQPNGTFKITFNQFIAEDVTIDNHVGTFIAHPGDSIHIDIDFDNLSSPKFTGDGARTNIDVNKYTSEYYGNYDRYMEHFPKADNYKAYCENLRVDMLKNLDEFKDKEDPNPETKEWMENYIDIRYYTALLKFFPYQKGKREEWLSSKKYCDVSALLNAPVPSILNSEYYELANWYLAGNFAPQVLWKNKQRKEHDVAGYIARTNDCLKGNEILKQIVLGSMLSGGMQSNDIESYDKNKDIAEPNLQPFVKQALRDHRAKIVEDFKNRDRLSKATFAKLKNTPAQSLIDSIRRVNKGKVIYLDFWSIWCGPCLGELPSAQKLEQKLADPNVVFVSICIDSDKKEWEKMVAAKNLPGQQYFATGPQAAAMRQAFGINGVPHHMLFDQNGNIVESSLFLSPGDPLTEKKIRRLSGIENPEKPSQIKLAPIK